MEAECLALGDTRGLKQDKTFSIYVAVRSTTHTNSKLNSTQEPCQHAAQLQQSNDFCFVSF